MSYQIHRPFLCNHAMGCESIVMRHIPNFLNPYFCYFPWINYYLIARIRVFKNILCNYCSNSKHCFVCCPLFPKAQRCVTELRSQVNRLEAEAEEQRTHKQIAMVENEHLRMEIDALRSSNAANVGAQIGFKEADGRCMLFPYI